MIRNSFKVFLAVALALLCEFAMAAATVTAATGTVRATPGAGAPRVLKTGDRVVQGDMVSTEANSSVVLRFDDDQIVALTGNSRLQVSSYAYNQKEPEKSNILLNLAQGGMRAITGLIGKARPTNVAYRAGNATIGIRGTDLEIGANGDDLFVIANEGEAEVEAEVEGEVQTGSLPMSGNMFGMTLPVASDSLFGDKQFIAAKSKKKVRVTVTDGFIVVKGIGRKVSSSQVRRAVENALTLAGFGAQLNTPAFQQLINTTVNAVKTQASVNRDRDPDTDSSKKVTVQLPPPSNNSANSGGGLPSCSTISPATARNPGVNCTQ